MVYHKPNTSAPKDDATITVATHQPRSDAVAAPPVKVEGDGAPVMAVTETLVVTLKGSAAAAEALMAAWADLVADAMAAATETLSEALLT